VKKTMQPLLFNGEPVYIEPDTLHTVTWGAVMEAEYGPITEQGCDQCESGRSEWVKVWVER
jgi:hypothetical protein